MVRSLPLLLASLLPTAVDAQTFLNINPDWSPDGRRLAFESRRDGGADLWLLDVGSGSARRLTADEGDETHPAWSPDGTRLAFDAYRDSTWNLWLLDPETGDARPLTAGPPGAGAYARHPSWSPDGATIAFDSDRAGDVDVWAVELATGTERRLTRAPGRDTHPECPRTAPRSRSRPSAAATWTSGG